uniref:Arginine/serine-rich protein 1 n=1 Tax=Chinchilla lanigera TaxID=34839 RepID=A0A8C2VI47_CHILA
RSRAEMSDYVSDLWPGSPQESPAASGSDRSSRPSSRSRSRSSTRSSRSGPRSRSRSPLRLSEKDRMELLEIAKANAAKALGTTNFDLPASLRTVSLPKETSHGAAVAGDGAQFKLSEKLTEDGTKNSNEKSSQQRNTAVSANSSVAKPKENTANIAAEEKASGLPKIDKKKSPYGLWIPVK